MKITRSLEDRVFRTVKRACYAGLDSVSLRTEVASRIADMIPSDGYSLATVDPDTGLMTHSVVDGLPIRLMEGWMQYAYPCEAAQGIIDQARTGQTVSTDQGPIVSGLFREMGVRHEMRSVLCSGGALWGSSCLLRGDDSRPFQEREIGFMRRIAPHVANGLRKATLIEQASVAEPEQSPTASEQPVPGLLIMDDHGRVQLRNQAGRAHVQDLADVGLDPDALPSVIGSAVAHLRLLHRTSAGSWDGPGQLTSELRVRGRSGRWYAVRASLAEPDAAGRSSTVVIIDPQKPAEVAALLTRVYGLSPREREIVALCARGESTKQIAAKLGLSVYTVQEHLGKACEKVGVRNRKTLLARLFFDAYAPRLAM